MKSGFYLYCIRGRNGPELSGKGIDGKGEIFTVPYRNIEAVACEVSLEKFSSEEIQRKAREDLRWIKEKAQLHEQVIEQAMKGDGGRVISVIPMKFGTIFKTKKSFLEETLKKHYSQFREGLVRLKGKQEWAVKVYLIRRAFDNEVKKASPVVQEKEKEISQLPEGIAYFRQRQIDEAVLREADTALQKYIEIFFESIKKYAAAGTKGKILEKELTGKSLPMVLNAVFLVSERRLGDFMKKNYQLAQKHKKEGFHFEHSGPWPPYHFV